MINYEKFGDGFVYYKNIIQNPKDIIDKLEYLSSSLKSSSEASEKEISRSSWEPWSYEANGKVLVFCDQLWLDEPNDFNKNEFLYDLKSELFTSLSTEIKKAYDHFSQTLYPYASRNIKGNVSSISVLKYIKSGFLPEHIDQGISSRVLSVLVYLNDDYEGGEITFPNIGDGGVTIKPEAGSVIFFPSNFVGVHSVAEITSGTRYALPNWYHNRIDKKESDGSE